MRTKRITMIVAAMGLLALLLAVTSVLAGSPPEPKGQGKGIAAVLSPTLMHYQGRLTDAGGNPLNATYDMVFSIYDAASGGTLTWTESYTGTNKVSVVDGVFNVWLGSQSALEASDFADGERWLEVQVGTEVLSPRRQITNVAYAFVADTLAPGAEISGILSSPVLSVTNNGAGDGVRGTSVMTDTAGVRGSSEHGTGVRGASDAGPDAPGGTAGVFGGADDVDGVHGWSTNRTGVFGHSANSNGVVGVSDTDGVGVRGESTDGPGVYGESTDGPGVYGESVNGNGVRGYSENDEGVRGQSQYGNGVTGRADGDGAGLFGHSEFGNGVEGTSVLTDTSGVRGNSEHGTGVRGSSDAGPDAPGGTAGVFGGADDVNGVHGWSTNRNGVFGHSEFGNGVVGVSDTDGTGVRGESTDGPGVYGESTDGHGVYGESVNGNGVRGYSENDEGVRGQSQYGNGVTGRADGDGAGVFGHSEFGNGVEGASVMTDTSGVRGWSEHGTGVRGASDAGPDAPGGTAGVFGGAEDVDGVHGWSTNSTGVFGHSANGDGVVGLADGDGAGVQGHSTDGPGVRGDSESGDGVFGHSAVSNRSGVAGVNSGGGPGVYAASTGIILAGYDEDPWERRFYVDNDGEVYADGAFHPGGADFAEMLPAADDLEPGDVLVIGADGKLARSTTPYATNVAGVYSTQPGFVGVVDDGVDPAGKVPLAVVGVVPVKVSAESGSIRPGDLLTTSPTPGHAMKAINPKVGTIIGKALASLESGTGLIPVLITLQ